MNRRVPNGTHGGVRGRKSPLETFSYSMGWAHVRSSAGRGTIPHGVRRQIADRAYVRLFAGRGRILRGDR